jgi:hypothetical protein
MKTTTVLFGTRSLVIVSLLALPAGSTACGAAPDPGNDGVEPSASAAMPTEKTPLTSMDGDAAPPSEEPTGELPDQPSPGRGGGRTRPPGIHLE